MAAMLKLLQTLIYTLLFCCAAIILGIYSYFIAALRDNNLPVARWKQAVEGLSGAALLYLLFAIILTCFLGAVGFFATLGILLNLLFCGAFIAIAVLTRDGVRRCRGFVKTPLGNGPANSRDPRYGANNFGFGSGRSIIRNVRLGRACKLNRGAFILAIIGAILFFIAAILQFLLARKHKRDKRYGPSPTNGYTSGAGAGTKFWNRKRASGVPTTTTTSTTRDVEMAPTATGGVAPTMNGTPLPVNPAAVGAENTKYQTTGGYHTGPTGSAVDGYGYNNNNGRTY